MKKRHNFNISDTLCKYPVDFFCEFDILSLVMYMNFLDNLIVTGLHAPIVIHSQKGREYQMTNRYSFGLSLCINGQITYAMGGKTYVSTPNNAVLLPKDGTYSLHGDKTGLFPLIDFHADNLDCNEITTIPLEDPQSCLRDFDLLKNLFSQNGSSLKKYSVFYELLSKIFLSATQTHNPLTTILNEIEENLSFSDFDNNVLAEKIGISEVYLRKLFVTHCNTTPKQYILDRRIQKAQQLLVNTSLSVTAISEACGFSSLYHFCRTFKQRTGNTPTQYASKNRVYKL